MSFPKFFPVGTTGTRKSNWTHFEKKVIDYLRTKSPMCGTLGLLPDLLPEARVVQIFGQANMDAQGRPQNPGLEPQVDTAENARLHQKWIADRTVWRSYQEALAAAYSEYCDAIVSDEPSNRALSGAHGYITQPSLAELHAAMRDIYGTLSTFDVNALNIELAAIWDPSAQDMASFVASKATIVRTLTNAGFEPNYLQPIIALETGVRNSTSASDFNLTLEIWKSTYPTPATQTFANLSAALITKAESINNPTASAHGYVAASAQQPATAERDSLLSTIANLEARLVAMEARPRDSTTTASTTRVFCHTHGWCAHSSKDCKSPLTGHNNSAPSNTVPLKQRAGKRPKKDN